MATTSKNTSSRKPRTAARAASRPATRRAVEPDVEPEVDDVEVSASEAQEIEADGYVTAELCGEEVQVVPPSMWRASWQRALNAGQIDVFAEKILHPDDYDYYLEVDPTMDEWIAFVEDASARSGESLGKSRARSRSGGRTQRR
ncbi:hypothetical protein GCM10010348_77000 [Streptomyces anthocyanicus]|uniref:hypothetical protein n=1 Tax=Streptomyces anthocyanicus TaxID=68174 RepID=UPI0018750874|nr:hypothetical protein [Streptomyces anthocyanicus]GHC38241.1 hypothetical protein GCM10010348_77000 [Streptomyces anthocyanicus]